MPILTIAYGRPADPEAFDHHYAEVHESLARAVPLQQSFSARKCDPIGPSEAPYLLVQLEFGSLDDIKTALASEAGNAAAADLPNFADGGADLYVQLP